MFGNTLHHICSAIAVRMHDLCSNNRNVCRFNSHYSVLLDNTGQMCVELVVLMPIILVVILISYNVGMYTRYTCTMKYKPWPSSFVCAGVAFSPQAYVEHKKSLVVDRFRAGALV